MTYIIDNIKLVKRKWISRCLFLLCFFVYWYGRRLVIADLKIVMLIKYDLMLFVVIINWFIVWCFTPRLTIVQLEMVFPG